MSYQDTLNKKKSIHAAKKELQDFSDLMKLHSDYPEVQAIKYGGVSNIKSKINYDQKQLHSISKKDEQMKYIDKMINAIMKLDEEEIQYIYYKYVLGKSEKTIELALNISERKRRNTKASSLFNLSILLGCDVKDC